MPETVEKIEGQVESIAQKGQKKSENLVEIRFKCQKNIPEVNLRLSSKLYHLKLRDMTIFGITLNLNDFDLNSLLWFVCAVRWIMLSNVFGPQPQIEPTCHPIEKLLQPLYFINLEYQRWRVFINQKFQENLFKFKIH